MLCAAAGPSGPVAPLRVAVVAAHPDDEIMGAVTLLRRLTSCGGCIDLIHVTDGAPRCGGGVPAQRFSTSGAYARARRLELARALDRAAIACRRTLVLGVPDQEAAFHLTPLAHALAARFAAAPVDVVLTHAFEGGHPDHDAACFAVHHALSAAARDTAPPLVVEFTSYHVWSGNIRTGAFLPSAGADVAALVLSAEERRTKAQARDCFDSQAHTLSAFGLDVERFRIAPRYAFDRRPHPGRLFYEYFNWGLDAERWCREASRALLAAPGVEC